MKQKPMGMRIGESVFCIGYLCFVFVAACIFGARGDQYSRLCMLMCMLLGGGDAFHLIPRVLNYFSTGDFTAALGIGKLVTSITMTLFYLLVYYVWLGYYRVQENRGTTMVLWILALLRIALCLFPQNGWLQNSSDMTWGIIRNIPFTVLGAIVCFLYFRKKDERRRFRLIWLYILLSFLFYIPVAVGAGIVPMLGMLMLPKTVCYILMVLSFLLAVIKDKPAE